LWEHLRRGAVIRKPLHQSVDARTLPDGSACMAMGARVRRRCAGVYPRRGQIIPEAELLPDPIDTALVRRLNRSIGAVAWSLRYQLKV
jgi:hypothetical protein